MKDLSLIFDIESIVATAIALSIKLAVAILIFVIGKWLVERIIKVADKMMQRSRLDETVARFLSNILYGILLVVVIIAALGQLGVNTNSIVAILGGATVAIGISLKDQLSNFAAGLVIVIFRPFSRGDYIEVNDTLGTVDLITILHTRLITINNHELIIPNSKISTTEVINYTSLPNRRVDITVGIGYNDDIKVAKDIMLAVASEHPLVFQDPEPVVRVTNLGDSSVDITLNVWSTNNDWWTVNCDLLERIKVAMDTHNINIPFPQRSIQIEGLEKLLSNTDTQSAVKRYINKD